MTFSSLSFWTVGLLTGFVLLWIAASAYMIWGIETPKYEVVKQEANYEIRRYAPYIIAETDMSSTSSAFSVLADYIFGGNEKQSQINMTAPVIIQNELPGEKIAMTAPVVIQNEENKPNSMYFIVPSEYTLETLPKPKDQRVRIKKIPEQMIAVRTYSWFRTDARFRHNAEQLILALQANNIKIVSSPAYAGYNPPFTIPFFNRHEVWVNIEG